MFRLFVENLQCKHIFFGGCHDTGYLSLLTPFRGKADRITLLKAASYHSEFHSLHLDVQDVSSLFRIISLDEYAVNGSLGKPSRPMSSPTKLPLHPKTGYVPPHLRKDGLSPHLRKVVEHTSTGLDPSADENEGREQPQRQRLHQRR